MEYVEVESSQIAEVGFGEGYYGPETLGLRFPPTKKQVAAGEDGSEYHYQNVTPRMHQALMAAPSIGSYFGQNIKSRPDLYPFMKVEADPHPAAQSNGNGQTQSSTMKAATDGETPAPVTALAVIDTMADDLLFTPNAVTDAQLAAGRDWYLAEAKKYDIATERSRMEFKRFARPLQKLRTGIEARAKELTGATKRKIAAIDAEKRRLVGIVGGIEDEVLAPLTSWETEEEARKIRLAGICNELAANGQSRLSQTLAPRLNQCRISKPSTYPPCRSTRSAQSRQSSPPLRCSSRNWRGARKRRRRQRNWRSYGQKRQNAPSRTVSHL